MTEQNKTKVPAELIPAGDYPVVSTDAVMDKQKGKTQEEVNTEAGEKIAALEESVGDVGSVDTRIENAVNIEKARAENVEAQLNNEIDILQKQDVVPVDSLPSVADADPKKIYRVVGTTSYTDYMVDTMADPTAWKTLATYSFPGIDDTPTAGSENLVKSGGVAEIFANKLNNIEYGTLLPDGTPNPSIYQARARTADFFKKAFTIECNDGYRVNEAYFYNSDGSFVSYTSIGNASYAYNGDKYIKLTFKRSDNTAISDLQSVVKDFQYGTIIKLQSDIDAIQNEIGGFNYIEESDFEYAAGGENILDTTAVTTGMRVTDVSPYFTANYAETAKLSSPMKVNGETKFTWKTKSKSTNSRFIAFCSDIIDLSNVDPSKVIRVFNPSFTNDSGVSQSKTIEIPNGTIYIYCTLRTKTALDEYWVYDTIAFGETATDEPYKKSIASIRNIPIRQEVKREDLQEIEYKIGHLSFDSYEFVKQQERLNVLKKYLPISIGTPNDNATAGVAYDRANILFFTDSHIDLASGHPVQSLQNVVDTISFANDFPKTLDAMVHGGDFITNVGNKDSIAAIALQYFTEIKKANAPFVQAIGNHDSNDHLEPLKAFYEDDWSNMYFDWAETNNNIIRQTKANGKKSTWHYFNIPSKKIRVIALDTNDIDRSIVDGNGYCLCNGANTWYIGNEQLIWLANTALSFSEEGWGVIVTLHQFAGGNNYSSTVLTGLESSIAKMFNMLVAFNNHQSFSMNAYTYAENSFYNLSSISKDFSYSTMTNKPHVICLLVGHEHTDKYLLKDGINIIWTGNGSATMTSSDSRLDRTIETVNQNLFDIVSVDTRKRKIRIVRYGAGVNCYGNGGDRFLPDGLSY